MLMLDQLDEPNQYLIRTYQNFDDSFESIALPANRKITFTTPDPNRFPLPSPIALRTHSIIAKILDQTGIADQVEGAQSAYGGVNECRSLAPDGSTDPVSLHNIMVIRLLQTGAMLGESLNTFDKMTL